jgi:hypothetical protein
VEEMKEFKVPKENRNPGKNLASGGKMKLRHFILIRTDKMYI